MLEKYQKILSQDSERSFKSIYGEFKSLEEFRDALQVHKDSLYSAYVYGKENHFSNWVEGVFQDSFLANSLRNAKNADETLEIVDKRIQFAKLSVENETFFSNFLPPNPITTDFTPAADKFHRLFDPSSAKDFLTNYFKAQSSFENKLDVAALSNAVKPKKAKTVQKHRN